MGVADTKYNYPGRYFATPKSLASGSGGALQTTVNGVVRASTTLPGGGGTGNPKSSYSQPGRYNTDPLSLDDGDYCALQLSQTGQLLVINA